VIPLIGKASELLLFKSNEDQVKAAFFTMPNVEVGSILEYRWTVPLTGIKLHGFSGGPADEYVGSELAMTIPDWKVQQEIFVHREHFYFDPFGIASVEYIVDGERANHLLYTEHLPAGVHVVQSARGDFTLDIRDVPAIRRETDSLPTNSLVYKVGFYFTPYSSPSEYWENEGKRLAKKLDRYAHESSQIKEAVAGIVAATDGPEARARKIYDAVQALDNTDFSRAKSQSERKQLHLRKELKNADQVWNEKSGSGNDLAALYLALARAAGLDVYGVTVVDRGERIFDANYLSVHQLDALLIDLRIDGKEVYLDPGEKLCPFGQLHWSHALAGGIAENVKGLIVTPQNLSKDGITAHNADLTLDPLGNVKGSVKIIMNGPEALRWRQLNLTSSPEEVKHQFNEMLRGLLPQGISGEVDHFQGLESSVTNLGAFVTVAGQLGTMTGKRITIPAFFFNSIPKTQFVNDAKRESAIDLHYAEQVIDDVVYHLPVGFTVEGAPPAVQLPWSNRAALVVQTTSVPGTIEVKQIFARAFVLLDPSEFSSLPDFYRKIATTDQQELILAKGAIATGN
jgi:hypothetical protein